MLLAINQISELTGRDRRRIAKQLKDLQYTAGERGANAVRISRGAAARLCQEQSKAGWIGPVSQRSIPMGKQS